VKSKKLAFFIVALLFLGFLAIGEGIGIGQVGASPLNPGFDGTTTLVNFLESNGWEVEVVRDWRTVQDPSSVECGFVIINSPEILWNEDNVKILTGFVRRNKLNLIIADESTYSNLILQQMGLPERINGEIVIVDERPIFQVNAEVGDFSGRITLSYTSSLHPINGNVFIWYGEKVFGVIEEYNGSKIFVISDGSVFINSALNPLTPLNPQVKLLLAILKEGCGDSAGIVFVDATHYRMRPLTLADMEVSGYSTEQIYAGLLNPARAGLLLNSFLESSPPFRLVLAYIFLFTLFFLLFKVGSYGIGEEYEETYRRGWKKGRGGSDNLGRLCKELPELAVSDVCTEVSDKEKLERLNKLLRENLGLRDKVLAALRRMGRKEGAILG